MKKKNKRLRLDRETLTALQLGTTSGGCSFHPPASKIDCPSNPGVSACQACTWG